MVKGVNKTVIEISDTESEVFEKVVLYVRPQYSALKQKDLEREAKIIIRNYSFEDYDFLPDEAPPKNKRFILFLFGAMLVLTVAMLFVIF